EVARGFPRSGRRARGGAGDAGVGGQSPGGAGRRRRIGRRADKRRSGRGRSPGVGREPGQTCRRRAWAGSEAGGARGLGESGGGPADLRREGRYHRPCRNGEPRSAGSVIFMLASLARQIAETAGVSEWLALVILKVIIVAAVFLPFISLLAMIAIWAERKVAGHIQARIGPKHVGPFGLLQSLADGIKLLGKEDIIPAGADAFLDRKSVV